jgi:RNA polymerase sigma factor for flagellar operon FliA
MAIEKNRKLAWNNQQARDALDRYEMTVRMTAKRLKPVAALGQALDEDDLCAEGRVAVLEALSTYEGFGIEEHTWVRTRIRQRMIDAIRRLDLRSRDEIRLVVRHAAGELENDRDTQRGREVAARRLISFDSMLSEAEPLANKIKDSLAPMADEVVQNRARKDRLMSAIGVLPPRQRVAIELGLFEGLALREIGDRMGISESRVCQLQKRAVQHLQRAINQEVTKNAA